MQCITLHWLSVSGTNQCASDPCLNGGICNDGNGHFTCTCPGGFYGSRCEWSKSDFFTPPSLFFAFFSVYYVFFILQIGRNKSTLITIMLWMVGIMLQCWFWPYIAVSDKPLTPTIWRLPVISPSNEQPKPWRRSTFWIFCFSFFY